MSATPGPIEDDPYALDSIASDQDLSERSSAEVDDDEVLIGSENLRLCITGKLLTNRDALS